MNLLRKSGRFARRFKFHNKSTIVVRQFLQPAIHNARNQTPKYLTPLRSFLPKLTGAGFLGLSLFGEPPLEILNGRAFNEFTIGDLLGWGGCSTVWTVTEKDGKRYALKAMPVDADEFEIRMREINTMKRFAGSENVLQFHEAWLEKMTPELEDTFVPMDSPVYQYASCYYMMFIKTELCETNLQDWMQRKSRRNSQIWTVFRQVTEGLKELHDKQIMHRDIKPANVFINHDRSTNRVCAKLGDLGLAKVGTPRQSFSLGGMGVEPTSLDCTSDVGTLAYMAPEQRMSHYDCKVDMYALGMLLWELNAKQEDLDQRHKALMHTRATGKVGKYTELKTPESVELIEKLVQHDPINRPSASELLSQMDSAEL